MKNIVLLGVGLLLLVGAIVGAVMFTKRRGDTDGQDQPNDGSGRKGDAKRNRARSSAISGSNVSEASDGDDENPMGTAPGTDDLGLHGNRPSVNLNENLVGQKQQQQKSKRTGYSKQKFDEFD